MSKAIMISLLLICSQSVYAGLHDPTRPAKYMENRITVDTSTLDLGLTLISTDRKIVVINGFPLMVGEHIGDERVIAIESNSVRLTGPSGNITLFLPDKSVKKVVQKMRDEG